MKKPSLMLLPALLAACTTVGPDFVPPEPPAVTTYTTPDGQLAGEAIPLQLKDVLPEQWWSIFQSDAISRLVEIGLENSPTLTAAEARLQAAKEILSADTGSVLYPKIDANLDASRQHSLNNQGNANSFGFYNATINFNYRIDPFGGGNRYIEASKAGVDYQRFQMEAAKLTLVTNIIVTAITEASLREQIRALNIIVTNEAELLEIIKQQFQVGVIPQSVLLDQQASLIQIQSQQPELEKQLVQTRHMLARLLGKLPTEVNTIPSVVFSDLDMPAVIPVTLPSELTQRRPDIRAAEAILHQASAQIGVATTQLYPKLNLSANLGGSANHFSDLLSAGTSIWGIAAGLVQPIFQAGKLQAQKREAEAHYKAAAAEYRQQVLSSFQQVADTLLSIQQNNLQLQRINQSEKLAAEIHGLTLHKYEQGAISYLDVLNADVRYQQIVMSRVQSQAAIHNDLATLMYALGGGWYQPINSDKDQSDQAGE